ncbi:MAG: methionine adenosyltransferase [Candidatus Wildermuthbacteria bacterium RIFCSPHIGHO2_02_FULL_49_9]|uniref:Methionine adenosyltransferase n=2 Tax=Candidatus Wildermuthiibacteriota TaxID=1817923 RepID=A0A1G2QY30_9BACT|nr:MAG: methionine adenosyltransferase [Candidatus Wildermuthbacteria bacterium RIFCSPHIGHO2_01_FULL_49_22b]OHA70171.1 MAG: methionine adenosyltransferase [Candidatus Wildermuthbacteria bacterium RIFCSPHIGHO2_02_FULL_49_9]
MQGFIPPIYTAESVTAGHPDKVCDQISDAILDACLEQDPFSRVAVEVMGSHGLLVVVGEVTTKAQVDYKSVAREVYREIGYEDELEVLFRVAQQSPDIAQGVDTGGAGDQGIMYGFATDETPEFLPQGVVLAHKLAQELERKRKSREIPWLCPDGKTQVTIQGENVKTVLLSCQHKDGIGQEEIRKTLIDSVVAPVVGRDSLTAEVLTNPTGMFVQGGFQADSGLTGRKIMVDTYGGILPHGGGCFSGKDATKVDRSAAYMCRFAAKNLVVNGYAKQCLVSVAYAIGRAEPLMVAAANERGEDLSGLVREKFDFKPSAIIERLGLRKPIFRQTAAYGHFGRPNLPWEELISF